MPKPLNCIFFFFLKYFNVTSIYYIAVGAQHAGRDLATDACYTHSTNTTS